jgi:hypothetical protein
MKSSIHISSEKIEVLGYKKIGKKVKAGDHISAELPEGAVMNGRIIDDSLLIECVKDMRSKKPHLFTNATLIVDGNSILQKRISAAPKLGKRQYYQLAREAFADTTIPPENLVCDYHPLDPSRKDMKSGILAYAVDKTQAEAYESAFNAAGVKLKAIKLGSQAIIDYVASRPELHGSAFVLNVVDGVTLLSMLFQNGVNVFTSRTRLYSDDYERFIQAIVGNISGLIQFNRSEKFAEITQSYYLGLEDQVVRDISAVIPYPEISVDSFILHGWAGNMPPDAYFAFLGARLEDGIDLISSLDKLAAFKKSQRKKNYWIPAIAAITLATAAPVVYLHFQISAVDVDIDALNRYIYSEFVQTKSAEIDALIADTAWHNNIVGQEQAKAETEAALPHACEQTLNLITMTRSDRVTVTSLVFHESTGIIQVTAVSASESDSALYTGTLKENALVSTVRYTGYSYGSNGEYNFNIDVILERREGGQ